MSLAELGTRITSAEFEVWLAEDTVRADQCPSCGLEPRDLKRGIGLKTVKCPFCKTKYHKVEYPDQHGRILDSVHEEEET